METLKEFAVMTVIICILAGGAIFLLPLFTVWTVLPVFAFAVVLHLGHGVLYSHDLISNLQDQSEKVLAQSAVKRLTRKFIAITTVVLVIVTAVRAVA